MRIRMQNTNFTIFVDLQFYSKETLLIRFSLMKLEKESGRDDGREAESNFLFILIRNPL